MKPCILYLTCANEKEATDVSRVLLEKRLVVCVKMSRISSSFLWKGKVDSADEVLLMMESIEENFEKINAEVAKVHSYETYVLESIPVIQTTDEVKKWISDEVFGGNI